MTRNARKTRLVFFFPRYDSNTHQAVSQQASIFGTRNPPRGGTCLCAEVCVVIFGRTATPCDVRATCYLNPKKNTFFFVVKVCFPVSKRVTVWCFLCFSAARTGGFRVEASTLVVLLLLGIEPVTFQ